MNNKITPDDIEAAIASEHYFTAGEAISATASQVVPSHLFMSLNLMTICVLVLKNGFTVIGHAACAAPENFQAQIGMDLARESALRQVWPLLGYELKSRLVDGQDRPSV